MTIIYHIFYLCFFLFTGCGDPKDPAVDSGSEAGDEPPTADACAAAPQQAKAVFESYCYACHGSSERDVEKSFFVLRPDQYANGIVNSGEPDTSNIYSRMSTGNMPPPYEPDYPKPSAEEIETIRNWILCGAEDFNPPVESRSFISDKSIQLLVLNDVQQQNSLHRKYLRYVSLVHLYNAGEALDDLETYRHGLSRLINGLSWGNQVVVPQAIDDKKLVYRIDLRDYRWDETISDPVSGWEQLLKDYPYTFTAHNPSSKSYSETVLILRNELQTRLPYVFGDWLVHASSIPPLYHDMLNLPEDAEGFLALFGVDRAFEIATNRVIRAGFDGDASGVSNNNRIIERIHSSHGYCWVSDDFAEEDAEEKNILLSPLDYEADGGEMFCTLPNGLQAYFLTDGAGHRLDKGPLEVVNDPNSSTGEVINGLSCMRCHYEGIILQRDEIREHVEANELQFTTEELTEIYLMYIENVLLNSIQKTDQVDFMAAMVKTGNYEGDSKPVIELSSLWGAGMNVDMVAAEMGMTAEEFLSYLDEDPFVVGDLTEFSTFNVEGKTLKRNIYVSNAIKLKCYLDFETLDCEEENACGASGLACLDGQECITTGTDAGACIGDPIITSNPYTDSDADGLLDGEENEIGTDPNDPDSDNDGLLDSVEVADYLTNPLDDDSDDDGLLDGEEVEAGTNPLDPDSDNDGLSDQEEIGAGTDPNDADSDNDGLSDSDEVNTYGTDPNDADSDDDGLSDSDEVNTYGTDPTNPDSDNDGFSDQLEVDQGVDPLNDEKGPTGTYSGGCQNLPPANHHGPFWMLFPFIGAILLRSSSGGSD